jgi:hypothetical protein
MLSAREVLASLPKRLNIPRVDLKEMINVTLDTPPSFAELLECVHRKASDAETAKRVDDYFLSALLNR